MGAWTLTESRLTSSSEGRRATGESGMSSSEGGVVPSPTLFGSSREGRRILQVGHILTKREINSLGTLINVSRSTAICEIVYHEYTRRT